MDFLMFGAGGGLDRILGTFWIFAEGKGRTEVGSGG